MDDHDLQAEDTFYLHFYLHNPDNEQYLTDVWILLDIYSEYWFWPSWRSAGDGIDFKEDMVVAPNTSYHEEVLNFAWPVISGSADGLGFWGAAFLPDSYDFIGDLQYIEWEYN